MTNQQILNAFFTAASAVASMDCNTELEVILKETCIKLFQDATNASLIKEGLQKNFFVINEFGEPIITVKGADALFAPIPTQKKVITKLQVKPIEKQTDEEIISTFVESSFAICHRLPSSPSLQKKFKQNYGEIADAITCMTNTSNEVLFPVVENGVDADS